MRGGASSVATPSAIEDEIAVDFPADDIADERRDEAEVIDEQAIDWLDDIEVDDEQPAPDSLDTIRPGGFDNDFQLEEAASKDEELFELDLQEPADGPEPTAHPQPLDPTESTLTWSGQHNTPDPSIDDAGEVISPIDRQASGSAPVIQPFEMRDGGLVNPPTEKKKKGLVARLVNGVALAGGLVGILCILQLVCWWLVGIDPFNVALMLPKSVTWLTPYSLTEEGQRVAMQTKVRPTTGEPPVAGETGEEEQQPEEPDTTLADASPPAEESTTEPSEEAPAESTAMAAPPETTEDSLVLADEPPSSPETSADDSMPLSEPAPVEGSPDVPAEEPLVAADENSAGAAVDGEQEPDGPPASPTTDEAMNEGDETGASEPAAAEGTQDLLDDLGELTSAPAPGESAPDALPVVDELPASEPEPPAITNVPVYQPADIRAALSAAERAAEELNEARRQRVDVKQLTQIARDFYTSFCQLAETATLVDTDRAQDELTQTRALLANLAQDASKLRMVGTTASGWISRKLGNGVLVAGTIEAVQPVGRFQEVSLRPTGSDRSMVIVTAEPDVNTQQALTVGRNVLLAGYIVRDPELQLPGFLADEPTVVWLRDVIVATP